MAKATQDPAAGLRIGDRERHAAIVLLGEHWGAGRLDSAEFDDRTGTALRARTAAELALVFQDLPADPPAAGATNVWRRPAVAGVAVRVAAGVTAFAAVAEPYRLQVLLHHAHHLLYRLGG